jgi:hypothetical protein
VNDIDTRTRQQPLRQTDTPDARRSGHGSDGDGFAQRLQRLESSSVAADAGSAAPPLEQLAPDTEIDETDKTDKKDDANPVADGASVPVSLPIESILSELESGTDLTLTALAMHAFPPSEIAGIESLPGASSVMNLNDFAALLQRTGPPTGGEQIWRFTLQDSGLPLTQVALTGNAAGGHWSVALRAQGSDQQALAQHLQRLRTRLDEKLGQGVAQVAISQNAINRDTISREETP